LSFSVDFSKAQELNSISFPVKFSTKKLVEKLMGKKLQELSTVYTTIFYGMVLYHLPSTVLGHDHSGRRSLEANIESSGRGKARLQIETFYCENVGLRQGWVHDFVFLMTLSALTCHTVT
jgi:hypothetical protein